MKPIVKYAIWAAVIGAIVYAGMKGYKLYKAKQAAKAATTV
jgi:hypothetical protein